ncbi:bifunctional hydroxymethylpyrimidine kinase/phosphomethylpyrimidine kinase [Treponema sp.]|uniref:bifunctional hydroxymethylpyrimidine kinase/phosphomethylpyrimidine kinase n=1 Tax=Treponema sp. TaxID=166 RepID=UPI0025F266CD|nr:bifunctional hydroxymethylpyrimidine kinase/phosphomethylpyrimidine kinase [Treponema sp.]MCR5217487.1 bifunctional hydroxymethylpyrimidine kinase/phosphomethylpyrimidine kinase [Treponema sp.]
MKTALTIAGSDSSGGAGIQADLKTFTALGVYGMSAITAVTVQNTRGVFAVQDMDPEIIRGQIDAVFTDIRPDSVKIGMTSSSEAIDAIAEYLVYHKAENIVLDPVMVSTSGSQLLLPSALKDLENKLFPLATLITPNIPEAERLTALKITSRNHMEKAAEKIFSMFGCNVLLKGGHSVNDASDCFYGKNGFVWFEGKKINNPNTHGTGCTLSSAISANLAKGTPLIQSIKNAKGFLTSALNAGLNLGQGPGPLNHMCRIKEI